MFFFLVSLKFAKVNDKKMNSIQAEEKINVLGLKIKYSLAPF